MEIVDDDDSDEDVFFCVFPTMLCSFGQLIETQLPNLRCRPDERAD